MYQATPIKLKTGDWGAKTKAPVLPGDTLRIEAKNGKSWESRVSRVVWSGEGVSIVALESRSSVRQSRGGVCRECRGPIRDSSHHRAMGGLCGDCAFDEFDC